MAQWNVIENDANIKVMSEALKISAITAHVLANRKIRSKNAAIRYLNPVLNSEYDAKEFKDMEKAVRIIIRAKQKGVKIAVYGDYDVDGIMSTVILYKTLKRFGADVLYYIPHREDEGYGLNNSAVEKLHAEGVQLIITCDNGISALKEIEYAKTLAMAVIVLDHHEPVFQETEEGRLDMLPQAAAIVDPKTNDCKYPFKSLCAAGICYKFSRFFYNATGMPYDEENEYLILAAIATYCDIVDLEDENRIIAKNGTKRLNDGLCRNIGLNALIKERKLLGKELGAFDIGFIIGPCINASGRISHAENAVKLFTTDNIQEAEDLAKILAGLNDERKILTNKAVEVAVSLIEESSVKDDKVFVLYMPEIHESIAGIAAGKIKETKNRPTIVLTKSGDLVKGSARSIEGYNIFEELFKCRDLFERFGGHAMAAGLSLKEDNVDELRNRLNNACKLTEDDFTKIIDIDKEILLDDVTYELARELQLFEPFGKGNAAPVFCSYGVYTDQIDLIGENKKTLRLTLNTDGLRKIKAIAFQKADEFIEIIEKSFSPKICAGFLSGDIKKLNLKLDIAYTIDINEYNGNTSVQLRLLDFIQSPKSNSNVI